MTIKYKFVRYGEMFKCAMFEDLVNLENYHDIVWIDCHNNKLTVLPTLPNNLVHLNCETNKLIVLPILPQSLEYLWSWNNRLTVLPTLPNGLIDLDCQDNKLTVLPTLPIGLEYLNCQNNLLAFLPKFGGNLTHKNYDANPVDTYIREKCNGNLAIYHRINEQFATKLVRWYLDCRENPVYKFCRARLNREYDALMEEDTGGIMA